MTQQEQIARLRGIIRQQLASRLTGDCVLLDLPYHANIGDVFIWEGELELLNECGCRIVQYGSVLTWEFPPLPPHVHIVMHGGGSFGDLWGGPQKMRLDVVDRYPRNRITVFPQSVHYEDPELMKQDAERMAAHPDLTLCARDQASYDILTRHFRNPVLLVPDLAFCVDLHTLESYKRPVQSEKILFLKRTDKELNSSTNEESVPPGSDVADWPTMADPTPALRRVTRVGNRMERWRRKHKFAPYRRIMGPVIDRLAMNRMRPELIRTGADFLSPYRTIYCTRLHAIILAILLGDKEIVALDNTYGKLSSFYDTWLQGTDDLRIERIRLEPTPTDNRAAE